MDATNLFIRKIETRAYAEAKAVQTELTLDCSDLQPRDFVEYALQSLVIKWQATARRNAMKKENSIPIPTKATYVVPKPGVKKVMDLDGLLDKMSSEQKQALIAKLMEEAE